MTESFQRLLVLFDTLSPQERHRAVIELSRRWQQSAPEHIAEDAFCESADELYRELDAREETDASGLHARASGG